ncbi:MAG TPA: efflux RND transporter periplasmic adaptor subunit, partial [Acetobacteraceae bacterium]|nr:efflux RND transporter periplasmic adaptor subunit [Acetobacteraceae bacterium]
MANGETTKDAAKSDASEAKSSEKPEGDEQQGEEPKENLFTRFRKAIFAHKLLSAAGALVVVLVIAGGIAWWLNARQYESTDDATVDAAIVHIGATVTGRIAELDATADQHVAANAVLMKLQPAETTGAALPPSSTPEAGAGPGRPAQSAAPIELRTPVAGSVAHLVTSAGSTVVPGQQLLQIVPDQFWITAQFKETQLADMRVGQHADITLDAYPGQTFAGHVASFEAGAGQAFSLLPPDNANGNFVKTVQRVAVRINFDQP